MKFKILLMTENLKSFGNEIEAVIIHYFHFNEFSYISTSSSAVVSFLYKLQLTIFVSKATIQS